MPSCAALQRLLGQASEAGILIAALCHGNAALAGDVGKQLVRGKKVAVFSDEEERALGKEAVVPFLLETALRDAGAVLDCGPAGGERAVVDGKLITGQNPASSFKCASLVLEALSSNAPAGAPAASHPGSLTAAEAAAVLGVSPLPPGSSGPEAAAGGVVATSMGEDELGAAVKEPFQDGVGSNAQAGSGTSTDNFPLA
ncbi:DJ-1/PfpI family [Haematococcus lacustris]|uniref:DJ-1/PfpI family n=1 Tax=Haematococcus lacustris TaxID=44745 RepID=A0A699Z9I6_HAELA|nr:DJ-1/PfpI family [Haematococcus lacustris]